jgi:hypothetical protein
VAVADSGPRRVARDSYPSLGSGLNGDAPAGGHGFGKFWEMVSNELGANTDPVCEVSERGRQGWLDLKRPLQLTPNQLGIGVRVWLSPGSPHRSHRPRANDVRVQPHERIPVAGQAAYLRSLIESRRVYPR